MNDNVLEKRINMLAMVVILIIFFVIYLYVRITKIKNSNIENLTNTSVSSNEALQNLASAFNSGTATLNNLNITGNLTVNGVSTLGKYKIRDDRIGIPGTTDIVVTGDKWVKAFDYDKDTYAGVAGQAGGFAGKNLWCMEGNLWSKDISNNGSIITSGLNSTNITSASITNTGSFTNQGDTNIGGSLNSGNITATNITSNGTLTSIGALCYETDCFYSGHDAWGNGYKNNNGSITAALRMKKK